MTRGQLVIVDDKGIHTSVEYNGDMYPSGYGDKAIECLKPVKNLETYKAAIKKFNTIWNCTYPEKEHIYDLPLNALDMSRDYFTNWFSDYLYIKNITEDNITIVENDTKKKRTIRPGQIMTLCFGRFEK